MAQNTIATATINADMTNMTKVQIRKALLELGVELSNTEFKKIKKAELLERLKKEQQKVVVVEKMDRKADALLAKWDKLVKATATEYVAQSLNRKWALFYKNTKSNLPDDYLVKTRKLWGATSKVIKALYGEKNCNEDNIKQLLNVMVFRGYLNFVKVKGEKGENIIFSATTAQMNAMYKLSK